MEIKSICFLSTDHLFKAMTALFAAVIALLFLAIIGVLWQQSQPSIQAFGFSFLFSSEWNPVLEKFGALIPVAGTLITTGIALIVAVPVSIGLAIFLTEIAPTWLRAPFGTAIELLAAIPSIVYGMWGLFVLAPLIARYLQPLIKAIFEPLFPALVSGPQMGIGLLSAGLILALMIIPFIASVTRDVFLMVPPPLKESAYGLGCTTWEVIRDIVLPYGRKGIAGAVFLGMGRALGETMAVTFVIGNTYSLSASLFAPGNSIASTLANEFTEADGQLYLSSLIELGLVLFLITFIILGLAQLWLRSKQ